MSHQQIVDAIQSVLPHLADSSCHLQPSPLTMVDRHENYLPIFPYDLHSHPFFEWIWCVENNAFIKVGSQVYCLKAGDFCLLPPGEVHTNVYLPSSAPYRLIVCSYRTDTIYASINTYIPVNRLQCDAMISAPAPLFTASLLTALKQELETEQTYHEPFGNALISALAHLILRAFESPITRQEKKYFPGKISQSVNNYLDQHFDKSLSLEDVARALHISRNYLATLYKQETGKTIGQALTEIRLEYAKKLLVDTHLSVKEVSKFAGYARPEHFSRVFLRHTGMSPRRYGLLAEAKGRKIHQ